MKKHFIITAIYLLAMNFVSSAQDVVAKKKDIDQASWFSKSLEFKGIAVHDDDWQIWGCSPIIGDDGKTHLFVARWPEETGHEGWYTDSQIAHYVGETPEGPFKLSDIVLEGTGKDTWDKFAPHNSTIHKVGDTYALFYIANTGSHLRPSNQKIGLATSKSLYGPWEKVGKDGLILAPPNDSTFYNCNSSNGVVNPAFLQHPDGRFFLYIKSNDMRNKENWKPMMGLAIADKLEGPYKQLKTPVTKNNSIIEDGYAFQYGEKIYLVTTDNHGMIEFGGGLIWESDDGVNFSNPKQAFKRLAHYYGGELPKQSNLTKGDRGSKFERPQILMIDGKPSWLYGPSGTNTAGGKGSVGYVLKIREGSLPCSSFQNREAVTWPNQTKPGKAKALLTETKIILENNVLKCSWDLSNNKFSITEIKNHLTSEKINLENSDPIQFILENGEVLRSSDFTIKDTPQINEAPLNSDLPCKALQIPGKMIETTLYSKEYDLTIIWRGILRDGSNYIKQEFTIKTKEKLNVSKLVLWELPFPDSKVMGTVRGAPIVSGNIFFGYEHPTSDYLIDEEKGILKNFTHDIVLEGGQTIIANSIIGVSPKDQLRRAFLHYIERERAHPYHQFLHYISYYDMHYHGSGDLKRCDSDQFSEVIKNWRDKFILPYDVQFESFGFDDGWDDYENLWYIDRDLFPDEFKPQYELTKPFGSGLGFWLSPRGGYADGLQKRTQFAREHGYKILPNPNRFSLADPKYYERFLDRTSYLVKKYHVNYFKLDGFFGSATPPSGQLPIMEAATKLLDELRSIDNDLFINITIGSWPSPFWLNLVDCTWRGGADMDMMGVGTKSQQWITYRDAITYKNIVKGSPLYPLNSLMVQGVAYANHHRASAEGMINDSEKDFKDQVRSFFGAGYNLQELYISQDRMTKPYWDALAEAAKWSRENESIFIDSHWIGGNPEDLQVYGWASWQPQKGIITLRNPSESKQKFSVDLKKHLELPKQYSWEYQITSKWDNENEESELIFSESLYEIELLPFEVKVFEIIPSKKENLVK